MKWHFSCWQWIREELCDGSVLGTGAHAQINFNVSPKRTRVRIEQAFGIAKRRFACLHYKIRMNPNCCCAVIVACFILHNIAISQYGVQQFLNENEEEDGDDMYKVNFPCDDCSTAENALLAGVSLKVWLTAMTASHLTQMIQAWLADSWSKSDAKALCTLHRHCLLPKSHQEMKQTRLQGLQRLTHLADQLDSSRQALCRWIVANNVNKDSLPFFIGRRWTGATTSRIRSFCLQKLFCSLLQILDLLLDLSSWSLHCRILCIDNICNFFQFCTFSLAHIHLLISRPQDVQIIAIHLCN